MEFVFGLVPQHNPCIYIVYVYLSITILNYNSGSQLNGSHGKSVMIQFVKINFTRDIHLFI